MFKRIGIHAVALALAFATLAPNVASARDWRFWHHMHRHHRYEQTSNGYGYYDRHGTWHSAHHYR